VAARCAAFNHTPQTSGATGSLVEVRTAEEESALVADEFATIVRQAGGAVWARHHGIRRRRRSLRVVVFRRLLLEIHSREYTALSAFALSSLFRTAMGPKGRFGSLRLLVLITYFAREI
jgi:hypothetical protein